MPNSTERQRERNRQYQKYYYQQKKERDPIGLSLKTREANRLKREDPEYRKRESAKRSELYRQRKLKAVEYMGSKCTDCGGEFHPSVYDFHHLDPSQKDYSPGKGLKMSWDKAVLELNKCVMLCANCHRLRHHCKDEIIN